MKLAEPDASVVACTAISGTNTNKTVPSLLNKERSDIMGYRGSLYFSLPYCGYYLFVLIKHGRVFVCFDSFKLTSFVLYFTSLFLSRQDNTRLQLSEFRPFSFFSFTFLPPSLSCVFVLS